MFGVTEGCWNIVMYSVAGSIFPAARAMLNGLMMTFYSIGAYVGPAYYGWSLETTGEWSIGLQHMGAVTVVFGLLLIVGFKSKYTDPLVLLGSLDGLPDEHTRPCGGTRYHRHRLRSRACRRCVLYEGDAAQSRIEMTAAASK